ncbi:MAG: selenium metabolism-associated LysR family transcriptional regulator [Bacillota bacterium]
MNLNWLKTFVSVANTCSFSRTAKELNLTQPAVSKHIAALESLYGIKLIDRSRRTATLTEAGAILIPLAVQTLSIIEQAAREMDSFNKTVKGTLIIGASTIPGQYLLPHIIRRFQESYPQIGISLEIADTGVILKRVLEGNLYLGAVGAFKPTPGLEAIPFASDELVLVVPVDHPLARQKIVAAADLTGREVVWRESDSGTRSVIEERLRAAGFNPENFRIVAEMGSTEAVLASVEAGMGLSFVSRWAAETRQKNGRLVVCRITGLPLNRTLYLIHPKGRFLPRPVKAFIDFIKLQPELSVKDL